MISRRKLLSLSMLGGANALLGRTQQAAAQTHAHAATPASAAGGHAPVHTLNGWTLPPRMRDGVKEFHLVAEPVEHEFAPGCQAKCWGYNGSTPGPTIEAVEGDRVRMLVTNRLGEATSVHWHGLYLSSGMDGISGLTQPHIKPGETFAYEFTLKQHGSHMYHPHADEMVQLGLGMMGMFIIHPRGGKPRAIDRDYCLMLHNWALQPGTWRPDPSIMTEFNLWSINSKVFPAVAPMVARSGERVRIRIANLSMHDHPMHLHGTQFQVTGGDGGRWPVERWRTEVTELVAVGQIRDIEFTAIAGDWAFHCHKSHHTMNAMGHGIANVIGVDQSGIAAEIRKALPGYMAMGRDGMSEHSAHLAMGMLQGPPNTLPMAAGDGPFGGLDMGGMFTVLKVRDDLARGDYSDPGWYQHPAGSVAHRVSSDPDFGHPVRYRGAAAARSAPTPPMPDMPGMSHGAHDG